MATEDASAPIKSPRNSLAQHAENPLGIELILERHDGDGGLIVFSSQVGYFIHDDILCSTHHPINEPMQLEIATEYE
jgi:hypothetical protein